MVDWDTYTMLFLEGPNSRFIQPFLLKFNEGPNSACFPRRLESGAQVHIKDTNLAKSIEI